MFGDPDPLYIRARRALLDATDALVAHRDSIVLVGAQAIYLHTGESDLLEAGAPYTTDADFAIGPTDLLDSPLLGDLLRSHGFAMHEHPGSWVSHDGIHVDLMVPEALAGPGSRGARLGPHGKRVARRARGLEAALVDRQPMQISALDPLDHRRVSIQVAGVGALLIAKVHKIAERVKADDRIQDKDALDIFRLLQATHTTSLAECLRQLRAHELSTAVTVEAITYLDTLFSGLNTAGVAMAVRAVGSSDAADTIAASLTALTSDLLEAL